MLPLEKSRRRLTRWNDRIRRPDRFLTLSILRRLFSNSSPFGAYLRFLQYSIVVSSGAISPARAPASIDILQTVMRSSIDMFLNTSPGVFNDISGTEFHPVFSDDRQDDILRGHSFFGAFRQRGFQAFSASCRHNV